MIIFFTRTPELGQTKTRLSPYLNDEEILSISDRLIENQYQEIKNTGSDYKIYFSGKIPDDIDKRYRIPQIGKDLGEKMGSAIKSELENRDKAVLLGSDLIGLDSKMIKFCLDKLNDYDVVLVPTYDGGYGLVGMRKYYDIFSDIAYSNSEVLNNTIKKIEALGLSYYVTERILDIDEYIDLVRLEIGDNELELLGQGEYNLNFLSKDRVIRVNLGSQMNLGSRQLKYEYDALKFLEKSGVTPEPISYVDDSFWLKKPYLIMKYYEGRPLDYKRDLKTAAKLLSTIHNLDIEGADLIVADRPFKVMYDEFISMYAHYKDFCKKDEEIEKRIDELFRILETSNMDEEISNPSIINTELNNHNFIIGEKNIVIDWEKPIIGEAEQDLAHFLVPTTTYWKTDTILTEEEMLDFLDEYERYRPVDRRKFYKYLMYNSLRGVTWCSMAMVEYSKDRAIKNLDTEEKIKEYLSVDFLDMLKKLYKEDL